ncbi:MAG TPA: hypothetical protein VMZ69_03300 [Saprospiraceae bacterium]|nr:hypothetical protein [Saprospiraceae bacterium]
MKLNLFVAIIIFSVFCLKIHAQENSNHSLQLKIEPFEFNYSFPRLGIGFEQKWRQNSVWSMIHHGWDGIATTHIKRYFEEGYQYWSFEAGIKKLYPHPAGLFFIGARLGYDKTSANVSDDVFYDIKSNRAILYDQAGYRRTRFNIFSEIGQEFFFGKVALEYYGGFGLRRMENFYANINNPFVLNDVEPLVYRKRTQHKYAGTGWKPAFIIGIKIGYTISGSSTY